MKSLASKKAIRRLRLRNGDFVVVRTTGVPTQPEIKHFADFLKQNFPGVKVIVELENRPLRVIKREVAIRELQLLSAKLPDFEDISNVYHYLEERRKEILG